MLRKIQSSSRKEKETEEDSLTKIENEDELLKTK